jgi:hypothetical protein
MHIQTNKHKKYFIYPTGFISLLLLATLCIWYLQQRQAFVVLKLREVTWWAENMNYANRTKHYADLNIAPDPEEEIFDIHPNREFIEINLTSDNRGNKIKLDFAQLAIRELISTKDTVKGVHFSFDDHAKFWTLIRALDILEIENAHICVAKTNNIWVFNLKPRPILPKQEYPRNFCGFTIEKIIIEEDVMQEKINYIIEITQPFWLSGFLLLAIVVLSSIRIWRMFK